MLSGDLWSAELEFGGHLVEPLPVRSWQEFRDEGVTKQNFDYSCGAASLAGLMSMYGVTTEEVDIIEKVGVKAEYSMADLALASKDFGFKPVGLMLDYESLVKLRRPAIVYLDYWGDGHFSLMKRFNEHGVHLADPAWGNTYMRRTKFERHWLSREDGKGRIMTVLPGSESQAGSEEREVYLGGRGLVIPFEVGALHAPNSPGGMRY